MKYIIYKKNISVLVLLSFIAFGFNSCQKELDDAFTNPNQSSNPASIKAYAASATFYSFAGVRFMNWNSGSLIHANTFARQFTHGGVAVWFGAQNSYDLPSTDWGGGIIFKALSTTIGQTRVLWEQAVKANDPASIAIAKTLFIYNVSIWTKIFGDVPFTDIYMYDVNQVPTLPLFESQDSVFMKILTELGTINTSLSSLNGTAAIAEGDFLYKGDVKKWQKFVNTFRLRLALDSRDAFKKKGGFEIDKVITECLTQPLIDAHDNEAVFIRAANPELPNNLDGGIEDVYYGFGSTFVDFAPMYEFVNYLQESTDTTKSDPRLYMWCTPPDSLHQITIAPNTDRIYDRTQDKVNPYPSKLHAGVYFSITYAPLLKTGVNVSKFTTAVLGNSLDAGPDMRILTLSESKLLQAEAAVRNVPGAGSVKTLYDEGIKADMEYWGVKAGDITKYLASGKNAKPMPMIQDVMRELWVSYFTNNWQAWTIIKRTKFDELAGPLGFLDPKAYRLNQNNVMPSRFKYPDDEKKINPNANAAGEKMGGDAPTSLIFIDTRSSNGDKGKF